MTYQEHYDSAMLVDESRIGDYIDETDLLLREKTFLVIFFTQSSHENPWKIYKFQAEESMVGSIKKTNTLNAVEAGT